MTTKGHGEKITRKQELAIAALVSEPSIGKAAAKAGIAKKTLWRWLQRNAFREAYRKAKMELVRHAMAQLQAAMVEAVQTLRDVMGDIEATPSARVSAAKAVMALGLKATELEELEARVEKLEANLAANR